MLSPLKQTPIDQAKVKISKIQARQVPISSHLSPIIVNKQKMNKYLRNVENVEPVRSISKVSRDSSETRNNRERQAKYSKIV